MSEGRDRMNAQVRRIAVLIEFSLVVIPGLFLSSGFPAERKS
jgi:hypothetical protein